MILWIDTDISIRETTGDEKPGIRIAGEKSLDTSGVTCLENKGRETRKPSPPESGGQKSGRNPTEPEKSRTPKGTPKHTKPATRATALRGLGISRPREPERSLRKRTLLDIYSKESEIPYLKFEAAIRDLICALMERQDRMNEVLFCKLNDLEYRVDDLEQDRTDEGSGP